MRTSTTFRKAGECLYQNPDSGTYFALVKLQGKQFKQSLQTGNLPEARRKLAEFKRDLDRTDPHQSRTTLDAVVDAYLQTIGGQAEGTIVKKKQIGRLIKARWKGVQVRSIKKSEVLGWLAAFPFGSNTRNKYLRIVRSIFQLAVDDKIIAYSPLLGVKEEKVPQPIRKTPTLGEFQAIVDSIRSQPFADTREESADFVEFLGLAGLGLAEASALTWGDVNFDRGQIITFRRKTRQGFVIPIYPQVQGLLHKRLVRARTINSGAPPLPGTKVFEVANAKKSLEGACERLVLSHYTSRSFRRLFITCAIEKGVDIKTLSSWQGHRDGGALLLRTYTEYDSEAKCPLFHRVLKEALPDKEDRRLLRLFCGSLLLPSCRYEAALVCYGPGGTGKSTIGEAVAATLGGELVEHVGLSNLCDPRSFYITKLKHAAVNLGTELDALEVGESGNFKALVSGEAITARGIYSAPETFATTAKLWFLANALPRFKHGTDAEQRRTRFLRFDRVPQHRHPELKGRLLDEREGILAWCVRGLVGLVKLDSMPVGGEASRRVHDRFALSNDPLGAFIESKCVLDPAGQVDKLKFENVMKDFCEGHGIPAEKPAWLYRQLWERYPQLKETKARVDSGRVRVIRGLVLR